MKFGKWLSVTAGFIFLGSFLFGIQASSEPNQAIENTPIISAEGDQLFAGWLEQHKDFKKPSKDELEKSLTPLQFDVTQDDATERSFGNEYWDNKRPGIYVDIVSGEPLFSSTDKFKSGTGWPSFTKAISEQAMVKKADRSIFGVRTELRSRVADSHLGHVFDDGPAPTGKRYCINSASLRFIAKEDLAKEGYAKFSSLFDE